MFLADTLPRVPVGQVDTGGMLPELFFFLGVAAVFVGIIAMAVGLPTTNSLRGWIGEILCGLGAIVLGVGLFHYSGNMRTVFDAPKVLTVYASKGQILKALEGKNVNLKGPYFLILEDDDLVVVRGEE